MWNRIIALSRSGVRVKLIAWDDEEVAEEHLEHMRQYVEDVTVYRKNRAPFLALHPYYPTTVISRALSRAAYEAELKGARAVSPDIVFLEGLFGAILATSLAWDLDVPMVYRSQNIEHKYIGSLVAGEPRLIKRMVLRSNVLRTRLVERHVRRESSLIYDISPQDRETWHKYGAANESKVLGYYLSPDATYPLVGADPPPDIDVLYVGNLHSPNNVFGLRWFATKVAPLLKDLRTVVAGAKPSPELRGVLEEAGAEVMADPQEVQSLYGRARVLVNPIWHGSGVNIKMVEMLATGKPVVSTSAGTRGLARQLLGHVSISDRPEGFAYAIRNRLTAAPSPAQRADVLKEHDSQNVVHLVEDLRQVSGRR